MPANHGMGAEVICPTGKSNKTAYSRGLFHRLASNRSCWLARVRHAASIRSKASFVSSSSARLARKAQSAALSRKISAKLIPARWIARGSSQRITS
jgi:hypothetical protein